jgi:LacI family transcriptional regulator
MKTFSSRSDVPRIVDVARAARVSITTASRVLNGVTTYPVAAATRERVLAAARSLNYSPSALARALVTKRSRIVGVLVGDIVDPYFAEIVRGVEAVARQAEYLVIVCNTERDPALERRAVAALRDYSADAILFAGGDFGDEEAGRLLQAELEPVLARGGIALALAGDRPGLPAIDIDHTAAAAELTRYLIGLGHQRIAFIGGPPQVSTARARLAGFLAAMAEAGLPANWILDGGYSFSGGLAAGTSLAGTVEAIVAANDQMALGALAALRTAGLRVPADVSLASFGGTSAAAQAVPALTTLVIPREQIGAVAMQAVLGALAPQPVVIASQLLPYTIVVRESTAPRLPEDAR